jgi:hypothetical protein
VASQTCDHCGAIVAGDEQFCPSCGTFMDPMDVPRPRPRSSGGGNVISVSSDGPGDSPYEEFSLETPPPSEDVPPPPPKTPRGNGNGGAGPVNCPSCGALNPPNNRHCQECGARLRQGPLPTAPRPAVQATAGVRAALAISGLLLGVILIALFFNIFNGEDPVADASTSTTSTTLQVLGDPSPIDVLDQTCEPEGISGLGCPNLTAGTFGQGNEYQVSWEENQGEGVTIRLSFFEPVAISAIQWINIEDNTRFLQNYRARSLVVRADDSLDEVPVTLEDRPGTQQFPFSALNTNFLTIQVVEAYQAEETDNNIFDEIAIDEIVVIGRPVTPSSNTTVPGAGSTTVPGTSTTTTP